MSLSDIEQRILDEIGGIRTQLNQTCTSLTEVKTVLSTHLETEAKKQELAVDDLKSKLNTRLVIIGLIFAGIESITIFADHFLKT
jgi:regulator of replication initiation timing